MLRVYVASTALNVVYLLYYDKPSIFPFVVSFALQLYLYATLRKFLKHKLLIFVSLFTLSVPTSFVNIFAGRYGDLPISWYNIYFALLLFFLCLQRRPRFEAFSLKNSLLLLFWLIVAVLNSYDLNNALRDFINFLPLLFFYSIHIDLGDDSRAMGKILVRLYIISALSLVIPLVMQIAVFFSKGTLLGKLDVMPSRIGFGTIFSDYSFLSLFFSSAAAAAWAMNYRVTMLLLLISSVLTTARTGIVSFVTSFVLLETINSIKRRQGVRLIKVLGTIFALSIVGLFILAKFRQESFLNPTGRDLSMKESLLLFLQNPLFGFGVGTEGWKKRFGFSVPHNLVIQSLLQLGLVGTILLIAILGRIVERSRKTLGSVPFLIAVFYAFVTTLIGSMFIPDIMNSRFLPILVLLLKILNGRRVKDAVTYSHLF